MAQLKHFGHIKNTGRKCVVVFREIYNAEGHVIDENNCLIFETENLPESDRDTVMRIVQSSTAQSTGDLFNILARERVGNGQTALNWLVSTNRLRKFETSNIVLTPDNSNTLGLDKLNKIVKMQKTGASEADINNAIRDDTDMPPRQAMPNADDATTDAPQPTGESVLDDTAIAKSFLEQAETFEAQAKNLREQAIALDPSLKPKRARKVTAKKPPASK